MNSEDMEIKSTQPLASPIAQAINQALAALMGIWTEVGTKDIVVHVNGEPKAVLIPFEDYQILQEEDILTDMRDGRETEAIYQAWLDNPDTARPYSEFRAELVTDGLLDE